MRNSNNRARLLATSIFIGAPMMLAVPQVAAAQQTAKTEEPAQVNEIVVTGSRIPRAADTTTSAPVSIIGQQEISDRGYTQIGQALNKLSSIMPSFAVAPGSGPNSGDGRQYPNLFNLGAGRTLTLVNGRRMVTTTSGLGDRTVDTNIIPTGLMSRVEVVQGGGAAIYGSDAIAGVVNYILKSNFEGATVDVQAGQSTRNDYQKYSFIGTVGHNFADGRGNFALDAEWRKTTPLLFGSRKITQPVVRSLSNPLNTSTTDGISANTPVPDPHFWYFNQNGVIFKANSQSAAQIIGQFSADGQSIANYNVGTPYVPGFACAVPFCSGGDGYAYSNLAALYTGVETRNLTSVAHYDLTDHMRISGQLQYARTFATDKLISQSTQKTVGGNPSVSQAPIAITNAYPFLTAGQISSLSSLSPSFATGGTLYVSKSFEDLYPTREGHYINDIWRGEVALDGDFTVADRRFDYSLAYTHATVRGAQAGYTYYTQRLANAVDAVKNAAGQIVCRINATAIVDAACAPLNPFGQGQISPAARAYTTTYNITRTLSTQDDFLANVGGDLFNLPAGPVKFNLGYEHREESGKNDPSQAAQLGLITGATVGTLPTRGEFTTDEGSGEVLVPLVGGDFTLPFVERLEFTGQYRIVDNSLAGRENVWGVGGQWEIAGGLTLRASRSRNFRAPTITQLTAPQTTAPASGNGDPCDTRNINTGPAPAVRRAFCEKLFAANPAWGPLASFTDPGVNTTLTLVTSGGNPNLRNEVSNTTTYGLIWQPKYVPGDLTVVIDRVQVNLQDGLTAFTPLQFTQACADTGDINSAICKTVTWDSKTGYIATALNTTFNAAVVQYRGEVYNINYRFPLSWFLPHADNAGSVTLGLDLTRNESLKTIVAGVATQSAGTVNSPRTVTRFNTRYQRGPLAVTYELFYLPKTKQNLFDTIETTYYPVIKSNIRHSVSGTYAFGKYTVRAGIDNITNRQVSFPTYNYGDVLGRQYFLGLRASF